LPFAQTGTSATNNVVVRASGLSHSYGDRLALDALTVDIPRGCVFGLLGPNGSGKSTFLSILAAMEQPQSGSLEAFGEATTAGAKRRMGIVFQENTADPQMTSVEVLTLAGRLFGMRRRVANERGRRLLAQFGLSERADDAVESLSGGMRRRLELARALLHEPDLLLLDEPTTGVDLDERLSLWMGLKESQTGDRTVLLATNDLLEADDVCDQVALLRAGTLVASGSPDDLKRGLRAEALVLKWESPSAAQITAITRWPEVGTVGAADSEVHITADEAAPLIPRLFDLAGGAVSSVSIRPSTLEDAYLHHVGARTRNSE
jgi:ABC-2 type transport system ATP-binding protein